MTIYALSSGPGISGVAVIRVSGKETISVIKALTGKDIPRPRIATLRKINNSNTFELIDEGIILWFPWTSELHRRGYGRISCSW